MTPELEPIPPDLEALFDAERRYEPEGAVDKARVLERVAQTASAVGLGLGASHAGTHAGTTWLARLGAAARTKAFIAVGSLAVGGAIGGTVGYRAGQGRAHEEALATRIVAVTPTPSQVPAVVPSVEPAPEHAELAPTSSTAPTSRPRPASSASARGEGTQTDNLSRELTLVQMARTAIARRNYADALAATDEHAQQFPKGHLAEERESLAIQALAGADRGAEARARAARFRATYPHSLLLPAIDAALRSIP